MNWNSLLSPTLKWRVPVFLFATTVGATLSQQTDGFQNGPTLCLIKLATGLNCPFCGTTRSVGEILQLDFGSALSLNLYGFVVVGIALSWLINPKIPLRLWNNLSRIDTSDMNLGQFSTMFVFGTYSLFLFVSRNF